MYNLWGHFMEWFGSDFFFVSAPRLILKLGPRMDLGDLLPKESDGWKVASTGKDYAVWEKV